MSIKEYVGRVAEELARLGVDVAVSGDDNTVLTVRDAAGEVAEWSVIAANGGKIHYLPTTFRLLEQAGYPGLIPPQKRESYKILREYCLDEVADSLVLEVGAGTRPGWGAKKVAAACRSWQAVVDTIAVSIRERNQHTSLMRAWSAVLENLGCPLEKGSTHPSQQPWEPYVSHIIRLGDDSIVTRLGSDGRWTISHRTIRFMAGRKWVELVTIMDSALEEAQKRKSKCVSVGV